MEFKNYKEKQQFYKNRCKQKNTIWVSKDVLNDFTKKNSIIKGNDRDLFVAERINNLIIWSTYNLILKCTSNCELRWYRGIFRPYCNNKDVFYLENMGGERLCLRNLIRIV